MVVITVCCQSHPGSYALERVAGLCSVQKSVTAFFFCVIEVFCEWLHHYFSVVIPFPFHTLLQAEGEHTRARELLLQAPFLVPFTDRVRIYTVRFLLTYAICLGLLVLLSATNISNLSSTLSCDAFSGLNVLEKVNPQTAVDSFFASIVTCTLPLAS